MPQKKDKKLFAGGGKRPPLPAPAPAPAEPETDSAAWREARRLRLLPLAQTGDAGPDRGATPAPTIRRGPRGRRGSAAWVETESNPPENPEHDMPPAIEQMVREAVREEMTGLTRELTEQIKAMLVTG